MVLTCFIVLHEVSRVWKLCGPEDRIFATQRTARYTMKHDNLNCGQPFRTNHAGKQRRPQSRHRRTKDPPNIQDQHRKSIARAGWMWFLFCPKFFPLYPNRTIYCFESLCIFAYLHISLCTLLYLYVSLRIFMYLFVSDVSLRIFMYLSNPFRKIRT